jgi:hypothetical protein
MPSQIPTPDALQPTEEAKHSSLWPIACVIMAIVFGPALIAGVFSLLR